MMVQGRVREWELVVKLNKARTSVDITYQMPEGFLGQDLDVKLLLMLTST